MNEATLNALTVSTCEELLTKGVEVESRNGKAYELIDTTRVLSNPQNRHLYLHGRTNNIYGTLGELFWVLGGQRNIYPVLNYFVPRAPQYSDDGQTWRGSYGDRIYRCDQMNGVVQTFLQDGMNTRRALLAIYQPNMDSPAAIMHQGYPKSMDVPCSNMLWFWIRDNKFHCKLTMRSNDWIFGGSNINVLEFTVIQEVLLRLLQSLSSDYKNVELGEYRHNVINLHLYEATKKQAEDIVARKEDNESFCEVKANHPIQLAEGMDAYKMYCFFRSIYYALETDIQSESLPMSKVFEASGVQTEQNQLYSYALLCQSYIRAKSNKSVNVDELKFSLSDDLLAAVLHNKYTPEAWKFQLG